MAEQSSLEPGYLRQARYLGADAALAAASWLEDMSEGELTEDDLRQLVAADGPDAVDLGDPWDWALADRIGMLDDTSTEDLLEADRLWTSGEARRILRRAGISYTAFARSVDTGRQLGFEALEWLML